MLFQVPQIDLPQPVGKGCNHDEAGQEQKFHCHNFLVLSSGQINATG
jgi:hypothetical protein